MRIVLDTNVLISGIFFGGPPHQILKGWRDGRVKFVVTAEILDEYEKVARELSGQFPSIDLGPMMSLLAAHTELIRTRPLPGPICTDPADDKFLACAVEGRSKLIVSGDKHLLNVSGFEGIRVIKPRAFVDEFLKASRRD